MPVTTEMTRQERTASPPITTGLTLTPIAIPVVRVNKDKSGVAQQAIRNQFGKFLGNERLVMLIGSVNFQERNLLQGFQTCINRFEFSVD